jgi:hypothetical protein
MQDLRQSDPIPALLALACQAIQVAEFTEQGAFYIRADGEVEFKDRADVVGSLAPAPIEFDQTTGIPYANLRFAFDDKLIINQATMKRFEAVTSVSASNADSVAKYFPHGMNVENSDRRDRRSGTGYCRHLCRY